MEQHPDPRVPTGVAWLSDIAWRIVVIALGAWVVLFAIGRLKTVLVPVYAALVITAILSPAAAALRRRNWPPLVATLAVYLAAAVTVAALAVWLVPQFTKEMGNVGPAVSNGIDRVQTWLTDGPLGIPADQVLQYRDEISNQLKDPKGTVVDGVIGGAVLAVEAAVGALFAVVLSFFFVKDGRSGWRRMLAHLPSQRRHSVERLGESMWRSFSGYVGASAVNGLVNGVVLAIGLWALGVPLVLPLAVLTFLGAFFPLVGAVVVGAVAALVALADKGVGTALAVVAITVLIHNLEGYITGPLVLGRVARLRPATILLSQAIGGVLLGLLGLVLAVPLVAVAFELVRARSAGNPVVDT